MALDKILDVKINRSLLLGEIKEYLIMTLGLAIFAVSYTVFLLPYELVSGGVTGIASIIFYATRIPMQYPYFIINVVLLVLALRWLGRNFVIRTTYAIFVLSLFLSLAQELYMNPDGTFPLILGEHQEFMSIIIACIFNGYALALVFLNNGSTGGMDIVAAAINKYKDITIGRVFIIADFCIISSTLFIFHDPKKLVFGLCVVILEALILDYAMNAMRESVQFLIFSKRYKDIAEAINTKTRRGVTILDGHGWYTGKDMKVIVTLAKRRESSNIFRLIKMIDSNAFVSQSSVIGVYGEGFDKIKVKIPKIDRPKLVFATHNTNKLEEVRDILGDHIDILSLKDIHCHEDIPETAETLEGNSLQKAQYVYEHYHLDCFADDTGLEVDALDGAPGVHTARYSGKGRDPQANIDKLLSELSDKDDRHAQFRTCITLVQGGEVKQFDGIVRGIITTERQGMGGFGYDPIFAPEEYGKRTFAELGVNIKNEISHRARAIQKLADYLKAQTTKQPNDKTTKA
ncbi:MAG: non-canonical purine NTP diphosphatase [Prevotella sp.]|nr:non-canonical purine NTP diphosphatase [Candidatus Equicola stercoris]